MAKGPCRCGHSFEAHTHFQFHRGCDTVLSGEGARRIFCPCRKYRRESIIRQAWTEAWGLKLVRDIEKST